MRSGVSCWFLCVGLLVLQRAAWAADGAAGESTLDRALAQAADAVPRAENVLGAARQRLKDSSEQLEDFLTGGGPETKRRWREWLDLPSLSLELAAPQPDLAVLRQLLDRCSRNQPGLELPVFVAVRNDLGRLATAAEYAASADGPALYRQNLAELSECLARLGASPTAADAHQAGRLLGWFEDVSPAGPALSAAARARFCGTNAVGQISGRFVNRLLAQDFEERQWIADFILGSYTRGLAWSQGHVSFHVVPNAERGVVEVLMQGQVACPENIAERRRIAVYSSAETSIRATKRLFIDERGLEFAPAAAWCATDLQISDVEANRRLVERLAWRRANRLAPEAEQAATQRAEQEASSKLDQRAGASLAGANDMFCQKVRAPLIRLDALPASWRFWTDATHLRLSLVQHNRRQLAAAGPAPQFPSACDVALGAHASMINNVAEPALGGMTIRDETWAEMMKLLMGDYPRPLWVHDRAERWSVTFAKEQPLLAHFEGGRIGFTLRLASVTRGDIEFAQPAEITAHFLPKIGREGPELVRDGDVAVNVAGDGPQPEAALHSFLLRKFGAVFPAEIAFGGITPPAGGLLGRLRKLQAVEFRTSDGWLTLAYTVADDRK
jgi:hypothetical protein